MYISMHILHADFYLSHLDSCRLIAMVNKMEEMSKINKDNIFTSK